MRGDLIEVFKMITGKYDPEVSDLLHIHRQDSGSNTRGHPYKLTKPPSKRNLSHHFFTRRVVNRWNALPKEIVTAGSLNAFENRLDKHWEHLDIKYHFDVAMAKEDPFSATGGFGLP